MTLNNWKTTQKYTIRTYRFTLNCEIPYFMFSIFVIINQFSFVYCIRENRRNKLRINV